RARDENEHSDTRGGEALANGCDRGQEEFLATLKERGHCAARAAQKDRRGQHEDGLPQIGAVPKCDRGEPDRGRDHEPESDPDLQCRGERFVVPARALRHHPAELRAEAEVHHDREQRRVGQRDRKLPEASRAEIARLRDRECESRDPGHDARCREDRDVASDAPEDRHSGTPTATARGVRGPAAVSKKVTSPSPAPSTIMLRLYVRPRSTDEKTTWLATSAMGSAAIQRMLRSRPLTKMAEARRTARPRTHQKAKAATGPAFNQSQSSALWVMYCQ